MTTHLLENNLSNGQVWVKIFRNRLTNPDLLIAIIGIRRGVRHFLKKYLVCFAGKVSYQLLAILDYSLSFIERSAYPRLSFSNTMMCWKGK